MIKYYLAESGSVKEIPKMQPDCWISLTSPEEGELAFISAKTGVDLDALKAALDDEERPRIEVEDNYTLVLVDIPTTEERNTKQTYATMPLSVILTKNTVITVCLENSPVLLPFINGRVKNFYTKMKTRFILQLLYRNASLFLLYLRSIDKKSEEVEKKLHSSTKNKELIELLELEKSLVYFSTSLRSNDIVLQKMMKIDTIKHYPDDEDLLEDVIIENKQAIEMTNIYSGILSGMTGAFGSIISNNLNAVMRFLAIVTIVMSIPTIIFSAYGMNLNFDGMPLSESPWGFLIIIILATVLSVVVAILLVRLRKK